MTQKNVTTISADYRRQLTDQIIKEDLLEQTTSDLLYAALIALLTVNLILAILTHPILYGCVAFFVALLGFFFIQDRKLTKPAYYVLERLCVKKQIITDDTDQWQLWFETRERDRIAAALVNEELYDAAVIGEEFYVVFLENSKTPSLCYRKSEWTM